MKKLILSISILCGLNIYSQNTIPTTTCTGAMKITDSLNVNRDIMALGDITSKGEVVSTDTMRAQKDILIDGNAVVGGDLDVDGSINTNGAFYIKNQTGIGIFPPIGNPTTDPIIPPAQGTNPVQVQIGPGGTNLPLPTSTCADGDYNQWVPLTNNMGGQIQLFDNSGPNFAYNPGGSILNMKSWFNASSIDVNGGIGGGALLINYFCGKDVFMCTGNNGGLVAMGKKVSAAQSMKIGYDGTSVIDMNSSLTIHQNTNAANGVKVNTYNNSIKAFTIEYLDGTSPFRVYGNGKTQIGVGQPKVGGSASGAMLSVDGLILAKEVKIAIANTHWADYVFEKEYKLMPLKDVEKFIANNKHLPEVPNTLEVENNGIDVVEINATLLKKVEELTLYLIEQNKRLEKLEKENKILSKN